MQRANTDRPILHWFGEIYRSYGDSPAKSIEELNRLSDHFLDEMARNGVKALGPATASHVISMGAPDFDPNLAYDRDRFAHRYASNYESLQEVKPVLWKKIERLGSPLHFFKRETGTLHSPLICNRFLKPWNQIKKISPPLCP